MFDSLYYYKERFFKNKSLLTQIIHLIGFYTQYEYIACSDISILQKSSVHTLKGILMYEHIRNYPVYA